MNTIQLQGDISFELYQMAVSALEKIGLEVAENLYKPQTVAYDSEGHSLTAEQYVNEIDLAINEMEIGKDKGKTTAEVLKNISNAYHLE